MGTTSRAKLTKDQVLAGVDQVRVRHHACTLQSLADHLGVAKATASWWLQQLKDEGELVNTELSGSIVRSGVVELPEPDDAKRGRIDELLDEFAPAAPGVEITRDRILRAVGFNA